MKLIDLNRYGEIGANCTYVELGAFNILIDSGLHPKKIGYDALPDFEAIKNIELDLIVLTHCHLDHLGSLPVVTAHNPRTPVITTAPNATLAPRMLRNSINVMKRQREEHGVSEYPIFLHRDIARLNNQIIIQRFERGEIYYKGGDQIEVILHRAGHIVGAATVEIIYKHRRIVFSGDVLFDDQLTLPGAALPKGPLDTLILETTRGAKGRELGQNRATEIKRLVSQISTVLNRGGSCLIPVFALGRMQELFKIIHESRNCGLIPKAPVHAAGLGMAICEYFDKIRQQTHLIDFDIKMLEKMDLRSVDLNMRPGRDLPRKGIYIVSSGMMVEHTPSYKLAASLLPHPNNGLCFVGYCDIDSPGGELLSNRNKENFFFDALDYTAPIRASVDQFDLSGHADRDELLEYATQTEACSIVLTHGDQDARKWFLKELTKSLPKAKIIDPEPSITYQI
ncbi:MAG: MBL fold metallo-hydrolase [Verrucomicrobiota bacterium]|nr:MBL fold metallo-hydrolase [Verrucomicrobiota bacterium]MEC8333575.1 MBL fold metallo-hydrolase [Verrucomicrobiota bacterium]